MLSTAVAQGIIKLAYEKRRIGGVDMFYEPDYTKQQFPLEFLKVLPSGPPATEDEKRLWSRRPEDTRYAVDDPVFDQILKNKQWKKEPFAQWDDLP